MSDSVENRFVAWWNSNWPDLAPTHQALHAWLAQEARIRELEAERNDAHTTADNLSQELLLARNGIAERDRRIEELEKDRDAFRTEVGLQNERISKAKAILKDSTKPWDRINDALAALEGKE